MAPALVQSKILNLTYFEIKLSEIWESEVDATYQTVCDYHPLTNLDKQTKYRRQRTLRLICAPLKFLVATP